MDPLTRRHSSYIFGVHAKAIHRPQREQVYAYSVTGGAGGRGTRISTASFGGGHDYQFSSFGSESLLIMNEKLIMQHLNDRLASYMETVRNLEKANSTLEIKIREAIEKKGLSEGKDYSKYYAIIADLRGKIFDMKKGITQLDVSLDNAQLALEDFRVKMECELAMRQTVEADIARARKNLDDTTVIRLHLESEIEYLKEELIYMKKRHETDVAELRVQITQAGVHVDVDAPKGRDLGKILEEMRANYEKIILKNQEELKSWHESKITVAQVQVTESTTALKEAKSLLSETKKRYQALDNELQSALCLRASLEANLRDEMPYKREMEKCNAKILRLQEELAQIRSNIQLNTREYEHLLNVKVKLEAEIAEYRRLLDGGVDLQLEDALDKVTIQTKVMIISQTLVDGKVVSESKDITSSKEVVN